MFMHNWNDNDEKLHKAKFKVKLQLKSMGSTKAAVITMTFNLFKLNLYLHKWRKNPSLKMVYL